VRQPAASLAAGGQLRRGIQVRAALRVGCGARRMGEERRRTRAVVNV